MSFRLWTRKVLVTIDYDLNCILYLFKYAHFPPTDPDHEGYMETKNWLKRELSHRLKQGMPLMDIIFIPFFFVGIVVISYLWFFGYIGSRMFTVLDNLSNYVEKIKV